MVANYFLGGASGISKKSGNWWGRVSILTRNGFGQWETVDIFCADQSVWESVEELKIGDPVLCSSWANKLTGIQAYEDVPALLLDDSV